MVTGKTENDRKMASGRFWHTSVDQWRLQRAYESIKSDWVTHAVGFVGAVLIGTFVWMLLDRREVVRMEFAGFTPNILVQGEPATVTWKTKVFRTDCDGTVQRKIVDSHGIEFTYQMNRTVFSPEHAIRDQFTGQFIVPLGAAPGLATHITEPVRWCNVVQKYVWPIRNERYEVQVPIVARKSS